jgi:hypothetical protein
MTLPVYTLYDHPTDYPDKWVIRLFVGADPTSGIWLADTLHEARTIINAIAPGTVCLARHPTDDPKIVETWL